MESLSRTSLLGQAANVLTQTPDVVPHQYGKLFLPSDFADPATLLAGQAFDERGQPFSPGGLRTDGGEGSGSHIDRGRHAHGGLYQLRLDRDCHRHVPHRNFAGLLEPHVPGRQSSAIAQGVGIALLPQLFAVEPQMAQYVSGLVQNVAFTLVLFLPVAKFGIAARRSAVSKTEMGAVSAQA